MSSKAPFKFSSTALSLPRTQLMMLASSVESAALKAETAADDEPMVVVSNGYVDSVAFAVARHPLVQVNIRRVCAEVESGMG